MGSKGRHHALTRRRIGIATQRKAFEDQPKRERPVGGALYPDDPTRERVRKLSDKDLSALSNHEFWGLLRGAKKRSEATAQLEAKYPPTVTGITKAPVGPSTHDVYTEEDYVSLETETYDVPGDPQSGTPAHAKQVYGAVAARMWLGDPGHSELSAASVAFHAPILVDEQDDQQDAAQDACKRQVLRQIQEGCGLMLYSMEDHDRIEYKVEWVADGQMLQRIRMFVEGYIRPSTRVRPQDMTLDDVKEVAANWERGPGSTLGAPGTAGPQPVAPSEGGN
jgi:hypothetical protein